MLLKIYELIKEIESKIGNGAEVSLSAENDTLVLRVFWVNDNFHFKHQIPARVFGKFPDENMPIDYFVGYCKRAYAKKKTETATNRP